jgi:hypothetical protein
MIESATVRDLPEIRALSGFEQITRDQVPSATLLFRWLVLSLPQSSDRVVAPRSGMSAS